MESSQKKCTKVFLFPNMLSLICQDKRSRHLSNKLFVLSLITLIISGQKTNAVIKNLTFDTFIQAYFHNWNIK